MSTLPKIYLASQSPRRRELLTQIGVAFEVFRVRERAGRPIDVDEAPLADESPRDYVKRIAVLKSSAAWTYRERRGWPALPVLAADTTVSIDARILGKPADADDARAMLRALAGREHTVLTAVALRREDRLGTALSESTVRFRPLGEDEIDAYVRTGEPMDKAGAYAIQGRAQAFIPSITGSYSGIVGLPLCETVQLLRDMTRRSD